MTDLAYIRALGHLFRYHRALMAYPDDEPPRLRLNPRKPHVPLHDRFLSFLLRWMGYIVALALWVVILLPIYFIFLK